MSSLIVLQSGDLPAQTVCPAMAYDLCGFAETCTHRGTAHHTSYSCGALRAWAMTAASKAAVLYPYGNTTEKRFGNLKPGQEFVLRHDFSKQENKPEYRPCLLMKINCTTNSMIAVWLDGPQKGQEIRLPADESVLVAE